MFSTTVTKNQGMLFNRSQVVYTVKFGFRQKINPNYLIT